MFPLWSFKPAFSEPAIPLSPTPPSSAVPWVTQKSPLLQIRGSQLIYHKGFKSFLKPARGWKHFSLAGSKGRVGDKAFSKDTQRANCFFYLGAGQGCGHGLALLPLIVLLVSFPQHQEPAPRHPTGGCRVTHPVFVHDRDKRLFFSTLSA